MHNRPPASLPPAAPTGHQQQCQLRRGAAQELRLLAPVLEAAVWGSEAAECTHMRASDELSCEVL